MKPRNKQFKVYNDYGDIVFIGDQTMIENEFGLQGLYSLKKYVGKMKIDDEYTVVPFGGEYEDFRVTSKHERELKYLKKHLEEYGNTVFLGDIDVYLPELAEAGINVTKKRSYDKIDRTYYWVLERKYAEI